MNHRFWMVGVLVACNGKTSPPQEPAREPVNLPPVAATELRPAADFAAIADRDERSLALFAEASKVILHPRCVNCHPPDAFPRQGDDSIRHDPPVERGAEDQGLPALECQSCHQDRNVELARIPGAPGWHIAPVEMAWLGKSTAAICEQIKDPARNGGKTLAQIHEHMAKDALVGWGWNPGDGRTPAPGSQAAFGELIAAWIESGAACPAATEAP
jgi:hypothetical protein